MTILEEINEERERERRENRKGLGMTRLELERIKKRLADDLRDGDALHRIPRFPWYYNEFTMHCHKDIEHLISELESAKKVIGFYADGSHLDLMNPKIKTELPNYEFIANSQLKQCETGMKARDWREDHK